MNELYPLKFEPILKDKIWGSDKIKRLFPLKGSQSNVCGESWEISAIEDNLSVVSNGFLKGNTIEELIEIYMDELVGETVYERFGIEFPLLLKYIDTNDFLSVQVHPNDEYAKERHGAYGKTEMWYVVQADPNAQIIVGVTDTIDKDAFVQKISDNTIKDILNFEIAQKGDVFYLPAGRIHAIGKGIVIAEIQQTSDITYRLYDWDRLDLDGNLRELHVDLALDVVELESKETYKTNYQPALNSDCLLVDCKYFTSNFISFNSELKKDYSDLDSFVVYMTLEGSFSVKYNKTESLLIERGETVLIPASLNSIILCPESDKVDILEIFISDSSDI